MTQPKILIRDRIYIPITTLPDLEQVKKKYSIEMFNDVACAQCEYRNERPCATCESCANYQGTIKLFKQHHVDGINYIGLPVGDKRNIERKSGIDYDEYQVVDLRHKAPLQYKIKFTLPLREHQISLVDDFMANKFGMLEAPPRTGKTVLLLYLGLQLGQRMLLLANQHEYLQQFLWHIEGNPAEGIPKCTNLPELEAKYGKKLYGFPKTDEDFRTMQFMVLTYQQFFSEVHGKHRLKLVSENAGTVAVDEAHKVGASTFAEVLNKFYTRYRFGVTGTVERKDGRHRITKQIIGPVVAKTTVEALTPLVLIKDTGIKLKRDPKMWVYKMKALCDSQPRNDMIVQRCLKDVKAGHSVVIPLIFTKHTHQLVREINEAYGSQIAEAFLGGGADKHKEVRRKILARAKSGETKVIVGTRSLLQLGLNVPKWSAIYTVIPISNKPNYKQETSRIRTPMPGKRRPIVRLFYDSAMPASVACAKNCLAHMVEFKYEFSKDRNTQDSRAYLTHWSPRNGRVNFDNDEFSATRLIDDDDEGTTSLGRAGRK